MMLEGRHDDPSPSNRDKPVGFWAGLNVRQKKAALSYRGDENFGGVEYLAEALRNAQTR